MLVDGAGRGVRRAGLLGSAGLLLGGVGAAIRFGDCALGLAQALLRRLEVCSQGVVLVPVRQRGQKGVLIDNYTSRWTRASVQAGRARAPTTVPCTSPSRPSGRSRRNSPRLPLTESRE